MVEMSKDLPQSKEATSHFKTIVCMNFSHVTQEPRNFTKFSQKAYSLLQRTKIGLEPRGLCTVVSHIRTSRTLGDVLELIRSTKN